MLALDSEVLSAWYCSRPEVRRLLAIRETDGLRVFLQLEPAPDSGETHPAWIANRREWADDLSWHTCTAIRLEELDESADTGSDAPRTVVADLSWRDSSVV